MKKPITILARIAAAGALAVLAQSAQSQVLYNNTTGNQGVNFDYAGTTDNGFYASAQAGNEVDLAGSAASYLITDVKFQFDFNGIGTPIGSLDLSFYRNDATVQYNGYYTPGTLMFDSGPFSLTGFTGPAGSVIEYLPADLGSGTGPGVIPGVGDVVPTGQFTVVVTFTGLNSDETGGWGLYSPVTVGGNYGNAWINNGSGWVLATSSSGPALEMGLEINGTPVPDSSCLPISVLAVLAGFGWVKRFQQRRRG